MSIVQHTPISECMSATETSKTWHLPHFSKDFPKGLVHLLHRLLKTVAVSIDQHNLLGFMGEPQIQRVVLVAVGVVSCNATRPEVKVDYFLLYICTSSTAQGGAGSFFIETYRRGWLLWTTDGRANPLMDRQVAPKDFVVLDPEPVPWGGWSCVFGMVAMVAVVPLPQLLDVVWRSAVVIVVAIVAVVVV